MKVERRSSSPSKLFSRHSTFFSTRVHFRQNGIEEEEKIFTPRKKNFLFLFIMRKKVVAGFKVVKSEQRIDANRKSDRFFLMPAFVASDS